MPWEQISHGVTVGYHEPIPVYGLGIWRILEVVSNDQSYTEGFLRNISLSRETESRVAIKQMFLKRHQRQAMPQANLAVWVKA